MKILFGVFISDLINILSEQYASVDTYQCRIVSDVSIYDRVPSNAYLLLAVTKVASFPVLLIIILFVNQYLKSCPPLIAIINL